MLGHSSCSEAGSILFYSGYSYSWGAYCATRGVYPHCNEPNSNWDNYLLSKRNYFYLVNSQQPKYFYFKSRHLLKIMNYFYILYSLNNDCGSHLTIRIDPYNNARYHIINQLTLLGLSTNYCQYPLLTKH